MYETRSFKPDPAVGESSPGRGRRVGRSGPRGMNPVHCRVRVVSLPDEPQRLSNTQA